MVDRIVDPTPVVRSGISPTAATRISVEIRRRGEDRPPRDQTYRDAESEHEDPARRAAAARAARAYGGGGPSLGHEPNVVTSRSAAILGGDLDGVLRRAGHAIRQLTETLLGVEAERTEGLVETFSAEALTWVRGAVDRFHSGTANYAEHHDRLPIGVSFDDVRVTVDPGHGGLAVDVGGLHFRENFDFRARGVVFDLQASGAVRRPTAGFFVDTGETGAAIATAIIDRVRTDLPNFGNAEDTEGVCVLIRAEVSDYAAERDGGWVIDFDLLVPFDPGWPGTPPPRVPSSV